MSGGVRNVALASGLFLTAALAGCSTAAPRGPAGGIPVLVFHQLCAEACAPGDTYGISKAEFARMISAITSAGYETISMRDFVRAHDGDVAGLPKRPILLTFDDGRIDAYRLADEVLIERGAQATMFVITDRAVDHPRFHMQWPEIKVAAASGRWSIQLHAHAGHVQVPISVDARGASTLGAFYGRRQCNPVLDRCASLESFDDWKARAHQDIEKGNALLASEVGQASQSFAVPFSDYGQIHSNDPRIAGELRAFLNARFAVWFTQPSADPEFMTPSRTVHEVARYLVLSTTTAEAIEAWLARHAVVPRAAADRR